MLLLLTYTASGKTDFLTIVPLPSSLVFPEGSIGSLFRVAHPHSSEGRENSGESSTVADCILCGILSACSLLEVLFNKLGTHTQAK